tara:strand:- start:642 stop:800 length:159 start_codon:yes stop_codon:yes gene_type:complete
MEYQRNNWGTDDRFSGPDDQVFNKDDGLTKDTFSMEIYNQIKQADPIDLGLE